MCCKEAGGQIEGSKAAICRDGFPDANMMSFHGFGGFGIGLLLASSAVVFIRDDDSLVGPGCCFCALTAAFPRKKG
jgi:hypothetical protein